jgi:hypothetical protein
MWRPSLMSRPHLLLLPGSPRLQLPPLPTPMKTWGKCKLIVVMILPPARTHARVAVAQTKSACLRLPRQEWILPQAFFKESHFQHCYPSSSFVQRGWDGDAESLLSLMPFMTPQFYLYLLCPCYSIRLQVDCNRSSLQSNLIKHGSFGNNTSTMLVLTLMVC